jgi:glucose-1-phosphate adenylyltransferase
VIPPGVQIGVSEEDDLARGFVVDEGLTVLAKGQEVPKS